MRPRFAWVLLTLSACVDAPVFVGGTGGAGGGGSDASASTSASSSASSSSSATSSSSSGAGGCDADLQTSHEHCGACFHACDGPCVGGKCQPVVLAATLSEPRGIAVDDDHVYWVNFASGTAEAGDLRRMNKAGGDITVLAPMQSGPWDLELSDGALYWTNRAGGSIAKLDLETNQATLLAAGLTDPSDLVVGDQVYFVDGGQGTAFAVDKDGATDPVPLATGLVEPAGIALSGTDLFITDDTTSDVYRVPITGGGATIAFDSPVAGRSFQIATTPTGFVWCAFEAAQIYFQPFSASSPLSIGDGGGCWGVLTEGERVYWSREYFGMTGMGSILSTASDGTGLVVHAETLDGPTSMATDATAIYWSAFLDGQILRVNK